MPKLWAVRQLPLPLALPTSAFLLPLLPYIVGVYLLRGAALKLLKRQYYWGSGQWLPWLWEPQSRHRALVEP